MKECKTRKFPSQFPIYFSSLFTFQIMYAGENNFKTLPRHFGRLVKLEELDVSSCAIVYLPESLSECRSLVRLWISNNRYCSRCVSEVIV